MCAIKRSAPALATGLCLIFIEDIRAGKQVQIMRSRNHLNFLGVSHAGFLETLAVGKFCTPEKPSCFRSRRNRSMMRKGSVPQTPANTGVLRTMGNTSRAISTTMAFASP
jgi:hypothetical protein